MENGKELLLKTNKQTKKNYHMIQQFYSWMYTRDKTKINKVISVGHTEFKLSAGQPGEETNGPGSRILCILLQWTHNEIAPALPEAPLFLQTFHTPREPLKTQLLPTRIFPQFFCHINHYC